MSIALVEHGLHQVLDIVPNHMAIGSERSRWWWDVLENGPSSLYADAFDVDWDPSEESLHNRVLVPILAHSYGSMLEAGRIRLERTEADFVVVYEGTRLPVAPKTLDKIMLDAAKSSGVSTLYFLADAYAALPAASRTDWAARVRRHRDKNELRRILLTVLDDEAARVAVDNAVAAAGDVDALDALLQRQNYRLAHWRTAQSELDYRRFFDVTTLVGLRIDRSWVFEQTHRLILEIVGEGHNVDGLRVDHPDGLRDPDAYLRQLSARAPGCWIVVEKILARDEALPAWPVAGSTGYDALDQIQGVLTDASGNDREHRPRTSAHVPPRSPTRPPRCPNGRLGKPCAADQGSFGRHRPRRRCVGSTMGAFNSRPRRATRSTRQRRPSPGVSELFSEVCRAIAERSIDPDEPRQNSLAFGVFLDLRIGLRIGLPPKRGTDHYRDPGRAKAVGRSFGSGCVIDIGAVRVRARRSRLAWGTHSANQFVTPAGFVSRNPDPTRTQLRIKKVRLLGGSCATYTG